MSNKRPSTLLPYKGRIITLFRSGWSMGQIAKEYGKCESVVRFPKNTKQSKTSDGAISGLGTGELKKKPRQAVAHISVPAWIPAPVFGVTSGV
jgi:hypothetical protein